MYNADVIHYHAEPEPLQTRLSNPTQSEALCTAQHHVDYRPPMSCRFTDGRPGYTTLYPDQTIIRNVKAVYYAFV